MEYIRYSSFLCLRYNLIKFDLQFTQVQESESCHILTYRLLLSKIQPLNHLIQTALLPILSLDRYSGLMCLNTFCFLSLVLLVHSTPYPLTFAHSCHVSDSHLVLVLALTTKILSTPISTSWVRTSCPVPQLSPHSPSLVSPTRLTSSNPLPISPSSVEFQLSLSPHLPFHSSTPPVPSQSHLLHQ